MRLKSLAPLVALAALPLLAGCSLFGQGKGEHRPKTAVLGDRIPVLAQTSDAEIDPALGSRPVTVPAPETNADWPMPGGNPSKVMNNLAFNGLNRAWTARIGKSSPKARFAAAPTVAEGRVFVIDTDAVVHALDLKTGAKVWTAALSTKKKEKPSRFGGGVSYDDGKVFATDGLGDAAALDSKTGKLLWKVRPAGPLRGAPTIAGGNIYVVTQDNQLYALSEDKGDVVWTVSATLETAGVFGVAAPSIGQGTVVAGFSSGELSALRYENGRVVWQDQLSRTSISTSVSSISDVDASPVVDSGRVYAIGQGGRMVAMDLLSGVRIWELTIAGIDTPWVAGDWLFVVTDEAKLLCLDKISGKVRWIAQLPRWIDPKSKNKPIQWNGPVLAGGKLYLTNTRGNMAAVTVADGKIDMAKKPIGKGFFLAPIVASGTMLTLDVAGTITAYR
ncbi:outer membrane protein assembly factor BamB [Sphingomonas vulcanisoli]|uniref:Outer membrane protein assembly factor BamB n=1 Tax=Sphingomonas vulcanisoli TaxID=1658060 RepID=A0ABX0TQK6_9SPHN|nr:PQQ-binding-like beta-propeller repeat protein [Sphingomonas vulcanisoli]NIJ07716.1 outer membrane protein assembly factor BamB [Sphingomonas vulcanisoli]